MRCGFTSLTQKPNNSHLSGRACYLHSQKGKTSLLRWEEPSHCFLWHLWSYASWTCSTRTNYKPALLHWQLRGNVWWNLSEKWNSDMGSPPWQHTCSLCFEHEFLANGIVSVVPQHSLCSPESPLCDFFIFPELKVALNGRIFGYATMIQGKL